MVDSIKIVASKAKTMVSMSDMVSRLHLSDQVLQKALELERIAKVCGPLHPHESELFCQIDKRREQYIPIPPLLPFAPECAAVYSPLPHPHTPIPTPLSNCAV